MALTLSHQSALDVIRQLRAEGKHLPEFSPTTLRPPSPWVGNRWSRRNFEAEEWCWPKPKKGCELHVLVPSGGSRMRGANVHSHVDARDLPAGSILWLDNRASVVCPELLFLQMAETFSLPALVMLGNELCGHFARDSKNPLGGPVTDGIRACTSVERIREYLAGHSWTIGLQRAREALRYVCDHAISAPESVLSTMYGIPSTESGYGMGPVVLNERVRVDGDEKEGARHRFPDLMFSFAPVGINYDGEGHLDLDGLIEAAKKAALADADDWAEANNELERKRKELRAKVVDDNRRNRQLASRGKIVFPVTKEDLYDENGLDNLTRQILDCARTVFGADTRKFEEVLETTSLQSDRQELLDSLLPGKDASRESYGKL